MSRKSSVFTFVLIVAILLLPSAGVLASSGAESTSKPPNASQIVSLMTKYPVGSVVIKDPTGTYVFDYVSPLHFSVPLMEYHKILADPYQRLNSRGVDGLSISGQTILLAVPPSNNSAFIIPAQTTNCAGIGAGFCSGWGVGGDCQQPTDSVIYTVLQTTNTISWTNTCTGGTNICDTAFWAGVSQSNTRSSSDLLVQNGVDCSYSTSFGRACNPFYEVFPEYSHEQYFPSYPTVFSGVRMLFEPVIASSSQADFYESVGTWQAYSSDPLPSGTSASTFVQAEGIMELPTGDGVQYQNFVEWSPNPIPLVGTMCDPFGYCFGYGYFTYYTGYYVAGLACGQPADSNGDFSILINGGC